MQICFMWEMGVNKTISSNWLSSLLRLFANQWVECNPFSRDEIKLLYNQRSLVKRFPEYRRLLKPLLQTVLKTLSQKEKLLKTSNFSFCDNVFNFFQYIIPSFIGIFSIFVRMFPKSAAACLLYVGKGYPLGYEPFHEKTNIMDSA